MPALKSWITAYWWLFKQRLLWGVLLFLAVGLVMVFGSLLEIVEPKANRQVRDVTLAKACQLVDSTRPYFIRMQAELDTTNRMYRTGSWWPVWGRCPVNTVTPLAPEDITAEKLSALMGCRVEVDAMADREAFVQTWKSVRERNGRRTTTIKRRLYATLKGYPPLLLVASEPYTDEDAKQQPPLKRSGYRGVLTTFNNYVYDRSGDKPQVGRYGVVHPDSAFVIGRDTRTKEEYMDTLSGSCWVPLVGADYRLFFKVAPQVEETFDGTVTGVLRPMADMDYDSRHEEFHQFRHPLRTQLPKRYAVIEPISATEHNRKEIELSLIFLVLGLIISAVSGSAAVLFVCAPHLIFKSWERVLKGPDS